MSDLRNLKLGFLGLGKMGEAIAQGLLKQGLLEKCLAYDPFLEKTPHTGIALVKSAQDLELQSDIILLCTKPQELENALKTLGGSKKYISIAAGKSIESIVRALRLEDDSAVARVMPNLAATVGHSVSGIYCRDAQLLGITNHIFSAIGTVAILKAEVDLHAVTGLSGSGPAFVFEFLHAMAEGGVLSGLPYDTAVQMASGTILGAIQLYLSHNEHPSVLRNKVTSPGGTTIAGLEVLEKGRFHATVMNAVKAATERSLDLAKPD